MHTHIILVFVAVTATAIFGDECLKKDSSNMPVKDILHEHVHNSHRGGGHRKRFDNYKPGRKSSQLLVNSLTSNLDRVESRHRQYASLIKTLVVAGAMAKEDASDLCIYADVINTTISIEQGDGDEEEFTCAIKKYGFLVADAMTTAIKKEMADNGCEAKNLPLFEAPACFDTECDDDGHTNLFEEAWDEYSTTTAENNESVDPDEKEAAKALYESEDAKDKQLASIITAVNLEINWIIKSGTLDAKEMQHGFKTIALVKDALDNLQPCDCEKMNKLFVDRMETFVKAIQPVLNLFTGGFHNISSRGHVHNHKTRRRGHGGNKGTQNQNHSHNKHH